MMSIFPLSGNTMPDTNKDNPFGAFSVDMTDMQKTAMEWMNGMSAPSIPQEFAGMANLSAHPMAAMAAASAVGMGMASQMFGMMMGTMAGAMEASTRLSSGQTDGFSMPNFFSFDFPSGGFAEPASEPATPEEETTETTPAPATAPEVAAIAVGAAPAAPEPAAVSAEAETPAPDAFVKPKAMDKPETPDDLKQITGIGPKLEQVLNGLGIWTYDQIAALSAQEVAWVDDYLQFRGRIERDGWIDQAAARAGK